MTNSGPLSFRHPEMFCDMKEKFRNMKKAEHKLNNMTIDNDQKWSIEFLTH